MAMPHSGQLQPGVSVPSRADLILSLFIHDDLFRDIDDNHPEGDVRDRLLRLRAIRAQYLEGRAKRCEREYDELRENVRAGKLDANNKGVQKTFERLMFRVDEELNRISRALEQDSRAAQAPVVDPHFMNNVFRYHIDPSDKGIRAPNGELKTLYGTWGDPVSSKFTTPRGCDHDFFRGLILQKLLHPLDERVYIPCRALYNRLLRRQQAQEVHGLGGRVLGLVVSALECVLSGLCISGSVILLYNLPAMKDRIIAGALLSLVFPYPITFLSKEALRFFALSAAFWAVMVVFIATSSYGSKNC